MTVAGEVNSINLISPQGAGTAVISFNGEYMNTRMFWIFLRIKAVQRMREFIGLFMAFFIGSFILAACLRLWYWVFYEIWL